MGIFQSSSFRVGAFQGSLRARISSPLRARMGSAGGISQGFSNVVSPSTISSVRHCLFLFPRSSWIDLSIVSGYVCVCNFCWAFRIGFTCVKHLYSSSKLIDRVQMGPGPLVVFHFERLLEEGWVQCLSLSCFTFISDRCSLLWAETISPK